MTAPAAARPRPLSWLYLLIGAAVFALGVTLGKTFFFSYRPLSLPYIRQLTYCAREFPGWGSLADDPFGTLTTADGVLACQAGSARTLGLTMLAFFCALSAGFVLLLFAVPMADRWRLRRHRDRFAVPGAQERFTQLCQRYGLTGRRQPVLLVAGPPVRQAFTTAVPGGRPTVVLPAAVAIRYADRSRFDPVVCHELGHVLARDVTWVAAVRAVLWLIVPAVLIAVAAELDVSGLSSIPIAALVRTVLLVAVTVVLSAYLLRLRELSADLHVTRSGLADELVGLLSRAPAGTRTGPLRRLLARHPAPADRIAAVRDTERTFEGGFVQGMVTGVVATIAAGAAGSLVWSLASQSDLSVLPAAAAGLLLGLGLVPSLRRRAELDLRTGAAGRWWRPVLGVAIGLATGRFVFPPGGPTSSSDFPAPSTELAEGLFGALLLAVAGAGAATLCAAMARLLAGREATTTSTTTGTRPPTSTIPDTGPEPTTSTTTRTGTLLAARAAGRPGMSGVALRAFVYVAASATCAAIFWPLAFIASNLSAPTLVRFWLVYGLPSEPWPLLALALPVACAALLPRRPARDAGAASAVPAPAPTATTAGTTPAAGPGAVQTPVAGSGAVQTPPAATDAVQLRAAGTSSGQAPAATTAGPRRSTIEGGAAGAATGRQGPGQPPGRTGSGWIIPVGTGGAAFAVAAVAGVLQGLPAAPETLDDALRAAQARSWVCALAGLAVLVPLALRRERRALAVAVVIAWPVTALAGIAHLLVKLSEGRDLNQTMITIYVITPVAWLIYLTALSVPVLAPARWLRLRRAPAGAASRRWTAPVGGALLAAALAAVVAGPGIPGVFAGQVPAITMPAPTQPGRTPISGETAPLGPAPTPSGTGGGQDPGRLLTAAEARRVAGTVGARLPAFWEAQKIEKSSSKATIEPATCRPIANTEYLAPLERTKHTEELARYVTKRGSAGVVSLQLTITVTSYAHPVPPTVIAEAETARRACAKFVAHPVKGSPVTFRVYSLGVPAAGEQSWGVRFEMSLGSGPARLTGTVLGATSRVGRNLVSVELTSIAEPADRPLLQQTLADTVRALSAPASPAGR